MYVCTSGLYKKISRNTIATSYSEHEREEGARDPYQGIIK